MNGPSSGDMMMTPTHAIAARTSLLFMAAWIAAVPPTPKLSRNAKCGQYSSKSNCRVVMHNPVAGKRLRPEFTRSEEHTSELQSRENLVCRLLLEKKKETEHGAGSG